MRYRITIFFLAVTLGILSFAKGQQITFQKTYDGISWPFITAALQSADGGYVFCGGNTRVFLIKTDSLGDTLWMKTYVDSSGFFCSAHDVIQTSDMGYVICGRTTTHTPGPLYNVYLLIKTDSIGNVIWAKSYDGVSSIDCYSVNQTKDGGYILLGSNIAASNENFYLLKTDSAGNVLWSKTYGGSDKDYGYSAMQTTDGGYILAGAIESINSHTVYLIKTDSTGNVAWSKTIDGIGEEGGYCVKQNNSGGFVVVGYAWTYSDILLVSLDSLGNEQWHTTYGGTGTHQAYSFDFTSDGGYILTGYTEGYYGDGAFKAILVKADSIGSVEWSKIYHGIYDYAMAYSVHQTFDGGYILTGPTEDAQGNQDFFLIKTDSLGSMGCNDSSILINTTNRAIVIYPYNTSVNLVNAITNNLTILPGITGAFNSHCVSTGMSENYSEKKFLVLSPNPVNSELILSGYDLVNGKMEICIYNAMGIRIMGQTTNSLNFKLRVSSLNSGIYYVIAGSAKGKFIKE